MTVYLVVRRQDQETWRECVARVGRAAHLESEVLQWFDEAVQAGTEEAEAAFDALFEWDCLDFEVMNESAGHGG